MPEKIKEKAREMARQELQRRLEELDMTQSEARRYGQLLDKTQAYMHSLHSLLECKVLHVTIVWDCVYLFPRSCCKRGGTGVAPAADRRRARL